MLEWKSDSLPVLFPCSRKECDGTAYSTGVGGNPVEHFVRVAPATAMQDALYPNKRERFARAFGELPDMWRNVWVDDLRLADALEKSDEQRASQLAKQHWDDIPNARVQTRNPATLLASHVTNGLEGIRFVIWRNHKTGKLRPGAYCEKARQAVYALLVSRLGRSGSLTACARCGTWFEKHRASQSYCSYKCRVAEAMKRYRVNKKKHEHGKSQSRKRGGRKKR